jgi:4-hydroxy-tetrahydrodipicolinate synthase
MPLNRVKRAICGISGVHITPYDDSGDVDHKRLRAIVSDLAEAGIHNIVTAGNTGEFYTLTQAEIAAVTASAVEAAAGRAVVTAGIGRSLREAKAMALAAKAAGADAVMIHQPLDPFAAPSGVADYFLALADAVPLPVVAYVRSEAQSVADIARIAGHVNVVGVKFATTNLQQLADCVRATEGRPVQWVCGLAESWAAPFYALGARGFTSGLANAAPRLSLAIWTALEAGDYAAARHLVSLIQPFEKMRTLHANGANVTVVKEALALMGADPGPVRAPGLARLDAAQRATLGTILASWRAWESRHPQG